MAKRKRIVLNSISHQMAPPVLRFFILLSFSLFSNSAFCTQYEPWLGNLGEFEWRNSLHFQTYHHLLTGSRPHPYASDDLFLETSLRTSIFNFGLELETVGANTRKQSGIDQIKGTGSYVWYDDVSGDPYSLLTGLSILQSFIPALHDPSSFHHGRFEAELFVSVGKEFSYDYYDDFNYEATWKSRIWGTIGLGASPDHGSPWVRYCLAYEKRFFQKHEIKIFSTGLFGFGGRKLHLHPFHGYGPIHHESIDIGLRYTHLIEFFGNTSVEYTYRGYAKNFPKNASQIRVEVLYLFGL